MFVASTVTAGPPRPVESEFLKTTGGGFMLEEGLPVYAMNFEITKDLPSGYHLTFLFESPKKGQPPIKAIDYLKADENHIVVRSVPLECIRNNKRYTVEVKIYADDSESELISTHKQKIEFRLPKQIVKQAGVPIC